MNRVQRIIGACAAAWLIAAGSIAAAQTQDFLSGTPINAVVRDAPFSADGITTVTQMLADGTRIERTTTSKFYRDSAGRVRRDQTIIGSRRWIGRASRKRSSRSWTRSPGLRMG